MTQRHPSHLSNIVVILCWASMAANGTDTLAFIDDYTADRGNRINEGVHRSILCSDAVKRIKTYWTTFHHSAGQQP